ncbi:MAG: hypothetical protein IJF75_06675 [Clostridia bacterium]|nr:hypothetical protein [Clostridia bacterium]
MLNRQSIINKCLSGATGYEKKNYLEWLNKEHVQNFDYEFMFTQDKNFGKLLIYGVRFADSLLIPEELWKKNSQFDLDLLKYVDGHIMMRLDELTEQGLVSEITICYFKEEDKERYEKIFTKRTCRKIIKYIDCNEIYY